MNDDLRDFELKQDESQTSSAETPGRAPRWPWLLLAVVVIVGLLAYLWGGRKEEAVPDVALEPEATATSTPGESTVAESTIEIGEVPELADSDAWMRAVVEQVSSHPQLTEWLMTPELVRGLVAVVDNLAEGANPRPHLEAAIPDEQFAAEETEGRIVIDSKSYERFDLLVEIVDSLDVDGTAQAYAAIKPLCEEAYADLGYPAEQFETTLEQAFRRVLSAPVIEGPIELERRVTAYHFADPALEELSPASKQLLRLGPENLRRLQGKLRQLARAMNLDV